ATDIVSRGNAGERVIGSERDGRPDRTDERIQHQDRGLERDRVAAAGCTTSERDRRRRGGKTTRNFADRLGGGAGCGRDTVWSEPSERVANRGRHTRGRLLNDPFVEERVRD